MASLYFLQIAFLTLFSCKRQTYILNSVQDFLIKLDMKPFMHLVEIRFFFTKSCHCQTYQNYEQSRQKLGTFLRNKVFKKKIIYKSWSPSQIFCTEKKVQKDSVDFWCQKLPFKVQIFANFEEVVYNFGRSDDMI